MTEPVITVSAPAKLNLYLHVTGQRADGYHLLDSLVAFAGVGDELTLTPADRLSLEIAGPFANGLSTGSDNLVVRAAEALGRVGGNGARMRLTKNLPVAAGIGGGSADAAAALRGLSELWDISPGDDELAALALGLGADVPVCLKGRAAFVGGVGEQLSPAPDLPAAHLVLVNPAVALSTPAVFAGRGGGFSEPARFVEAPADVAALAGLLAGRGNDLGDAAAALAPEIGDVLDALGGAKACLLARMSGSGATCFGLFAAADEARAAAERLAAGHPAWWVKATPLLG